MGKILLITSTIFLTTSGFAVAGEHPSFSAADTNNDDMLSAQELTVAVPELKLESTTPTITAAEIKKVMPEIEFSDVDVVNENPIGEEQYLLIVEHINEMENSHSEDTI